MAFECGPHEWDSCVKSSALVCKDSDSCFEGTMEIDTPDSQTGDFTGWFKPKNGGQPQAIKGKCSNQKPHMTVERTDDSGDTHQYIGNKSGAKTIKGKHKKSKAGEKARKPVVDDEWTATKTT